MSDAKEIVRGMSLEEKAAQLLIFGFPGPEVPGPYLRLIEEHGLGGLILFARNIASVEQTRALTASAQAAAQSRRHAVPLAIAVDQEGGTVVRLAEQAGYTHMPGNMALGAANDETLAFRAARVMGAEMRSAGITWNLAPVLDVNSNPANPVIGVRSFGADPHLVARLGRAAVQGFQAGRVAACGKHFPGHGDTISDSHLELPVVPHGRERLEAVEFVPFRAAIAAGVDSLMTAHVCFPALEPARERPATLSKAVLTGLLRHELGFGGVICTDCMEMKAIADHYSPEQAALMAVAAGADALLISHTWEVQIRSLNALLSAARSGRISETRIAESAVRIVQMKLRHEMDREFPAQTGTAEHKAVALEAARRAVTVLWGADQLPVPRQVTLLLPRAVPSSLAEDSRAVLSHLLAALEQAGVEATAIDCPPDLAGIDAADLAVRAGPGGTVVVACADPERYPRQAEVAHQLSAYGCRVIALSRRAPSDLNRLSGAAAGIVAFDDSPGMQTAMAEVLTGFSPRA